MILPEQKSEICCHLDFHPGSQPQNVLKMFLVFQEIGSAHLTFRTQPLGPEFGSGIKGQEFFLSLGNFPEPGIFH